MCGNAGYPGVIKKNNNLKSRKGKTLINDGHCEK